MTDNNDTDRGKWDENDIDRIELYATVDWNKLKSSHQFDYQKEIERITDEAYRLGFVECLLNGPR